MTGMSLPTQEDALSDDTLRNSITVVGNKVVPRQRSVAYVTQLWLGAMAQHFAAFVERSRERIHPVSMSFPVSDMGSLETKRLDHFEIDVHLGAEPASVTIRFCFEGEMRLTRVPNSVDGYLALRDFLHRHNLDFTSSICGSVAKIQLNPSVPVELRFTADLERAVIDAAFKNLGSLGETRYKLPPYDFNQALMHAIERKILCQPNRFQELTGNLVPLAERIRMSEQLAAANRTVDGSNAIDEGWIDKLRRVIS